AGRRPRDSQWLGDRTAQCASIRSTSLRIPSIDGVGSAEMRVLVVGTGGVGAAAAAVAARRDFFETMTLADIDRRRPETLVARLGDERFRAAALDASDPAAIRAAIEELRADAVLNATDPRFNPQIFAAAFEAGCTYLDMAMTLSAPGVLLGQEQLAASSRSSAWASSRACPTSSHAMPPTTSSPRSTRWRCGTERISSSRATTSPRRSRSGRRSRSA